MPPWIRQYQPKLVSQIVGQQQAISQVLAFLSGFPSKKGLIIHGPSGCGKTVSVYAIADQRHDELLEVNASDTRNKDSLHNILGNACVQQSFFGGSKIILVDEIEGISGRSDFGGVAELVRIVQKTKFPIIMTCQDPYDKKFKPLNKVCQLVEMQPLVTSHIITLLKGICQQEGIAADCGVLELIGGRSQGDARAAINDLQLLGCGKSRITKEDFDELTQRNKVRSIEQALTIIFKSSDILHSRYAFDEVEEDVDQRMLWLEHNMAKEYTRCGDLARGYAYLAKADVFKGRISRRQHWGLLRYVGALMSAGVSVAKQAAYRSPPSYQQTTRLLKIWQMNMSSAKKKAIAQKIADATHMSQKRVIQEFAFFLPLLTQKGIYRSALVEQFRLDADELAWLEKNQR